MKTPYLKSCNAVLNSVSLVLSWKKCGVNIISPTFSIVCMAMINMFSGRGCRTRFPVAASEGSPSALEQILHTPVSEFPYATSEELKPSQPLCSCRRRRLTFTHASSDTRHSELSVDDLLKPKPVRYTTV